MNTPHDDFDARAREAGRALRQAAPADGLRRIETTRRNRRLAQAGGALAVAVLGIGGIVAITRGGGDDPGTIADQPTVPTGLTTPPTMPPPDTAPTVPRTDPSTPPTSAPGVVSTAPPAADSTPTVWIGDKLAGYFDDGVFVAATSPEEAPEGLLGSVVALQEPGAEGIVSTATVSAQDCSSVYLSPSPGWGVWVSAGVPPMPPFGGADGTQPDPDVSEAVNYDLDLLGLDPLRERIFTGLPLSADGSVDAWVVNFGSGDAPTWIATWDDATSEFTTIEGDTDPSAALAMGMPILQYLDLDADGNVEIVFALGDGWDIRELATNESIVFGDGHPCPDPAFEPPVTSPSAPAGIQSVLGEWAFEPTGTEVSPATLWIESDGTYTHARYAACQDEVVDDAGTVRVVPQSTPECVPADADPRLGILAEAFANGAELRIDDASGRLWIGRDEGVALTKVAAPAGLDLSRGAAYGYYAGQYVPSVETLIADLSDQLGEPSHDTGWFVTPPTEPPGEPDCLADMTTRAIWWGDFVVSLWPDAGLTGGTIWNWTLGAEPTEVNVFADEPYTPTPNAITTVEGFGVGQPMSAIDEYYGVRFGGWNGEDVTQWAEAQVPTATPFLNLFGNYAWFTATDGVLDTIAAQKTFC